MFRGTTRPDRAVEKNGASSQTWNAGSNADTTSFAVARGTTKRKQHEAAAKTAPFSQAVSLRRLQNDLSEIKNSERGGLLGRYGLQPCEFACLGRFQTHPCCIVAETSALAVCLSHALFASTTK